MKMLFIIASLIPFAAFAGGTEITGGVPGRVLVECFGTSSDGTEIVARVQPIMGKGLTLRVIANSETIVWDKVKKDESDSRGFIYAGKHANLLIPEIQAPNEAGRYRAILRLKNSGAVILTCQ